MRLGVTLHDSSRIRRFTLLMCAIPGKKNASLPKAENFFSPFYSGNSAPKNVFVTCQNFN